MANARERMMNGSRGKYKIFAKNHAIVLDTQEQTLIIEQRTGAYYAQINRTLSAA
jgi:hypothetical protein